MKEVTKENSLEKIGELVSRFDEQYDSYRSSDYNETLTRQDFINPFFKALGWDIDNEQGYAESYREVVHEDKQKVEGATKAPDYSFRLGGGKRLFFVEAKKPSVHIKDDIAPAYQVRSYGWSAKLPISILTDFAEFAVYDCTKKPNPTDKASTARIKYLTYNEYLKEFDFLWNTFSKERVLKGSFDQFVQSDANKKGTATVDKDFLQSLDRWRTYLAKSISWNNKNLDEDEINFAVQQTIDRIIFLRIAEDRSVETYGSLKECIRQGDFYQNLFHLFINADEKYNSGIFDFQKDLISHKLEIENKIIKTIINELYYPECPYKFAYMPVEILGTAYEQFLGKVIRITPGHIAKIEEKPAVRKAGGVYYTPQYIVDYIVKNTVDKIIEGKTPKEISNIKIVDPACGSGSFLLGAYQCLLDYHLKYYLQTNALPGRVKDDVKPSKSKKSNILTPEGNLTTAEKKRILLNNIFGVDIDTNAVEVTKLSLLLKCMEGETEASITTQMRLFHERVLPDLDSNIKSGNSLIDTDYYDGLIDYGDEKKIKPFNWQKEFPDVFKQGGFDAVIGNPPYVQLNILDDGSNQYLLNHFKANTDLYSIFIERSSVLLNNSAPLGFIVPSLFLKGVRYGTLRNFINSNCIMVAIKEYGDGVFDNVQMPTCIILLIKGKPERKQDHFVNKNFKLFKKITTLHFGEISEIHRGLEIGKNKLLNDGIIGCITGSNLGRYSTKSICYISKNIYNSFSKGKDAFSSPKIMIRETGNKFFASMDYSNILTTRSIYNAKIINKEFPPEFILGIINSTLFQFYFRQFIAPETNIFPKIRIVQLNELPIPKETENKTIEVVIKNVKQLLKLNEEIPNVKLQSKIEQLQAHINHCEDKINEIVYRLYGLTEEEIKIVEGK